MNSAQRLEICKQTRTQAAKDLEVVLKPILERKEKISEAQLRDRWSEEQRKNPRVYRSGWYTPPPDGFIVLFGKDNDISRIRTSTTRPSEYWPQKDIFLDFSDGILFLYTSIVDKRTGVIGDFGTTIYLGSDKKVQLHLKTCLNLEREIFELTRIGMTLAEIFVIAQKLMSARNMTNNIASVSDPTGTNIGHTVVGTGEAYTPSQKKVLKNGDQNWLAVCDMIRKKRNFLNNADKTELKANMGITIEPRPQSISNPSLPVAWFHTIALYAEEKKEQLTNFENLFQMAGMHYMLR